MSASVSIGGLSGDSPLRADEQFRADEEPAPSMQELPLFGDLEIIEDTVSEVSLAESEVDVSESALPPVVADDVLDGFQDPIMPFVILGIASLIAIVVIAALLVL